MTEAGSSNGGAGGAADPQETARAFVDAVAWGEHENVWTLLGSEGRDTVLKIATKRGMDDALVARLRDGSAVGVEREEFLSDLVNGLRADLAGNDLDNLEYEPDAEPAGPGQARVVVNSPLPPALGGTLPIGTIELSQEGGDWRVQRLVVRTSQ